MASASIARRGRKRYPEDTGLSGCSAYYLLLHGQCKVPGKRRGSLPSRLAPRPRLIVTAFLEWE